MNVLLRGLLLLLEGVVPQERDGVDVVLIGGDREPRLHEAEGLVVGDEKVAPCGGGWIGDTFHVGAELLEGFEIVFYELSFALGVGEGDVVAEGAVEIE